MDNGKITIGKKDIPPKSPAVGNPWRVIRKPG